VVCLLVQASSSAVYAEELPDMLPDMLLDTQGTAECGEEEGWQSGCLAGQLRLLDCHSWEGGCWMLDDSAACPSHQGKPAVAAVVAAKLGWPLLQRQQLLQLQQHTREGWIS
jgi:hypothetical protein